jgi:hypothetical protein
MPEISLTYVIVEALFSVTLTLAAVGFLALIAPQTN